MRRRRFNRRKPYKGAGPRRIVGGRGGTRL